MLNITTPESSAELAQHLSALAATGSDQTRGMHPVVPLNYYGGDSASLNSNSGGYGNTGKLRSSGSRGVHFAEAKVAVGEAAVGGESNSPMARGPPSHPDERLTTELELCTPVLSEGKLSAIDEVLAEIKSFLAGILLASCGSISGNSQDCGDLVPIGAYHLGVVGPEDDIDTVFVVPSHMRLQAFIPMVVTELERQVQVVSSISDASSDGHLEAPGLRFNWRGIGIVVLFAMHIPDLPSPSAYAGIVQTTAGLFSRSVSEALLACVPNVELFRMLLRFIRVWAKRRGVYGAHFGFFSGTAWAICCARICQMHKCSQFLPLVANFFRTMSRWDWSQPLGVLTDSSAATSGPGGCAEAPESFQGMPVQLPGTAPAGLSATSRVTQTTARMVQKELRRGYKLVKQVELARVHWSEVYCSARFFQRHKHYLEFDFMAASEPVYALWRAFAKQQIQTLVPFFEETCKEIVTLRPWPEWLDFKDKKWPYASAVFVGLHLERAKEGSAQGANQSFDLREPIVKFMEAIATWPEADKYLDSFELEIRHVKVEQLEQWLDNREKGLVAHHVGDQPLQQGLVLQSLGEKTIITETVLQ
mmetsp:Transcript_27899/g.51014  ORF Transcript_27899/g.51014 Transcript_27899/m.51014 type:complete len:589 (+) Transcript_27899:94-1860(+)